MATLHYAIEADQVPPGRAVAVEIDGQWYAVCNDHGRFYVCDFHCPHEGGPLANGEIHDGCIVCPVHHWPWDLKTGLTDPNMPWLHLARYRTEVRGNSVFVDTSSVLPRQSDG